MFAPPLHPVDRENLSLSTKSVGTPGVGSARGVNYPWTHGWLLPPSWGICWVPIPTKYWQSISTYWNPAATGWRTSSVMTDVFSKHTLAFLPRDQRASTVALVLVSEWFYKFGVPAWIHSDQGRNFESFLIWQLCVLYGVEKSCTTPYHPASNGQCERFNRTLHNLLQAFPSSRKRDWHSCLTQVLYSYNTTPHQSTGESL